MPKLINPPDVHSPGGRYSHVATMPAGARWVHVSGQVGQDASGRALEGFAAQADQAWRNVLACLAAGGMGVKDLVKVTVFLVEASDIPTSREIRVRHLGEHLPASTLVVVKQLASPSWLIEVEAVAARAAPAAAPARKARTRPKRKALRRR
jgi:enamine deaminase RidA (YjgF/YER057c/UK114 family)